MIDFEAATRSNRGVCLTRAELQEFAEAVEDFQDGVLVAVRPEDGRPLDSLLMPEAQEIPLVVEAIDSSVWRIRSDDESALANLSTLAGFSEID